MAVSAKPRQEYVCLVPQSLTLRRFFDIISIALARQGNTFKISVWMKENIMQQLPTKEETERDYHAGFDRVMQFAEYAHARGWRLSDRQLVHEIVQHERAAQIREKSSLPIVGPGTRSAAYNRGQADALRAILQRQHQEA
jgi:hypothetical protein